MSAPVASIIIPTKDGLPEFSECLKGVFAQATPWPYEVIIVDSGSTDGTLEVARQYPCRVIEIPARAFNHGGTRNAAAEKAHGEFLIFLVQDAVPANDCWLSKLVEASQLPEAAGSYSRHLPHPGANLLTKMIMIGALPQFQERVVQRLGPDKTWMALSPREKFALATFRNNSSCIRKKVWEKYPFNCVAYGEDMDWGGRIIQAGYSIVYEPDSVIYHSHDRSAWYEFRRAYADHEMVMRLFGYNVYPRFHTVLATWFWSFLGVARAARQESPSMKQSAILVWRGFITLGARCWGGWLGARAASKRHDRHFWYGLDQLMRRGV